MTDDAAIRCRIKITEILNRLESATGIAFGRTSPDTWFLPLGDTTIHIMINGPWITFATEVMDDIKDGQPDKERDFWKKIIEESTRLNGVKIGREAGKITINSEYPASDIALEKFIDILILHINRYKQRASWIIRLAHESGLKI